MKNSQYANGFNINIAEMARLTFQEEMPQHDNQIAHIITISVHPEYLKQIHKAIGDTLDAHAEKVANIAKNVDIN